MVYMKWKEQGSYTVEGTVIVSLLCLVVGLAVTLGFYGHDRAVMQSVADELAEWGSLWSGNYVHPDIGEVDYEAMKRWVQVDLGLVETKGYQLLQGKLFFGTVRSISVSKSLSGREIQVEIQSDFQIGGRDLSCNVRGYASVFQSRTLPRVNHKLQKEEENES
jgi:hypothetical protein